MVLFNYYISVTINLETSEITLKVCEDNKHQFHKPGLFTINMPTTNF
jgi:hypothetical protein